MKLVERKRRACCKRKSRLGGELDFFLPRRSGARGTGTGTSQATNQGTFAAAGQAADQRTDSHAAADEGGVASTFSAHGFPGQAGGNGVALTTHGDARKPKPK